MSDYGSPPSSPPPGSTPPPPPSGSPAASGKGFFAALFDFSFSTFVTPMVVKVVYVLSMIALAIGYLVWVIRAFDVDAGFGVAMLIFGALGVIIYLALIRITLEFFLAVVRMSDDIHQRLPRG